MQEMLNKCNVNYCTSKDGDNKMLSNYCLAVNSAWYICALAVLSDRWHWPEQTLLRSAYTALLYEDFDRHFSFALF